VTGRGHRGRAALLAWALPILCGCKGGTHAGRGDSGAIAIDAGASARDAGSAGGVDASPPPDDTMLPPTSEELTARARHLLEAIGDNDPMRASDILLPRDAWLAMRDAKDAGRDWDAHVAGPFERGVHALSRRYKGASHAQAVSLELGGAIVQVDPRRHAWKKPVWTATGSRLTFIADGHTRTLSIREMVAWRGAWYVTKLR
jgi:hypothetical protein